MEKSHVARNRGWPSLSREEMRSSVQLLSYMRSATLHSYSYVRKLRIRYFPFEPSDEAIGHLYTLLIPLVSGPGSITQSS